jgi:hypothetical protein
MDYGWVITKGRAQKTFWNAKEFVPYDSHAVRFSRRDDAERVMRQLDNKDMRAEEREFPTTAAESATLRWNR